MHQLLWPLISEAADLPDLPDLQRRALLAAFGMRASPAPPDRFLVALAALEVLASVASRAPLLVVVDDAHWLDRSSQEALAFVARRLEAEPIVVLIALRDDFESAFADAALPHIQVGELDAASVGALLTAHAPGLAPAVRARILIEAMGNPLALLELPVALEPHPDGSTGYAQLSPIPSTLPLTARLERAFAARLSELPDAVRALALVAAAADAADTGGNPARSLAEILAAGALLDGVDGLDGVELTSELLDPAVQARLVAVDDQRLRFRHPLVRSAIYQAASSAQRRGAHAALARALADQPDHHADHVGASALFDKNVTRIGHEETRRLLLRGNDPARPPNEETFPDNRTLEIGGERIDLAWHGANHTPDNIFIHLPDHDTLMVIDIVNAGWAPIYLSNLTEDIPGYVEAPAQALAYPWQHYIGGHNGRLGTRDDVTLHQQYMADLDASIRTTLATLDPTPYFVKYGANAWAALKGYLDACADTAAAPVIEKYTGVLAAADVFNPSTAFQVMQSIRLDLGIASQAHP